jgi:thiol:disulfide interchange protein DsbD
MHFKLRPILMLFVSIFLLGNIAFSQPWKDKMTLDYSVSKDGDCKAVIKFKVKLIPDWHIFSVSHDPSKADFTGTPTSIEVEPSKNFKLIGKLADSKKPTVHLDDLGTSLYFENAVDFMQKVEVLTDKPFVMDVRFTCQICYESCDFVNKDFKIEFKNYKPCSITEVPEENTNQAVSILDTSKNGVKEVDNQDNKKSTADEIKESIPSKKKADSFWITFLKGFGGGLIALLTPCVFPMIPMTVTFFTKQSGSRRKGIMNVLLYGVSIILIYVTIGLVITAIMGPSGLNDLSTNVWMNLLFFSIFMIFAFSFLGAFEIRMPSKWVNKADGNADKGGLIGIFFMAFTLSLVSFSCTGPIIGTLLVESSTSGSMMGPAIGMIGFSSALAIPFTLFAIFPGWLNSLPQSGGWLNSVKVVLGLLELALALKFLSGIDLAYHWGVLTREIFIAIWIVIFFVIGFYLLGKLKFSHDSNVERLTVTRFMFALLALVFAVYLVPGMWGAPLKLIDGVAPPRSHSEDNFRFVRGESNGGGTAVADPIFQEYRKDMHEIDGDLLVFHDLDKAQEYAKKVNKPVLLDFTGYNCPNCRRTESTVWTDTKISSILKNEVVIASLYVDDKAKLPKSEWKFSKALDSEMRTVGNKWGDYQIRKYNQLSQPLYVLTDPEGNDLTKPMGYESNIDVYKSFLEKGLKKYKK